MPKRVILFDQDTYDELVHNSKTVHAMSYIALLAFRNGGTLTFPMEDIEQIIRDFSHGDLSMMYEEDDRAIHITPIRETRSSRMN